MPNIENPRKLFYSAMSLCCLCVKLMSLFIVGSTVSYFLGISHAWLLSKDNTVHRSKISLKSMAEFLLQLKLYLGGEDKLYPMDLGAYIRWLLRTCYARIKKIGLFGVQKID